MNNVFQNALPIAKQYDLKGSTQGRTSATDAPKPATILKDLDLDIKVKLEEGWHDRYYPVTFHSFLDGACGCGISTQPAMLKLQCRLRRDALLWKEDEGALYYPV
jgi:hypothetical protein